MGRRISIAEGFSGSGIVSRLFKTKAHTIYVNDIAGYSETLNKCYLANISDVEKKRINILINQMNVLVDREKPVDYTPWISKHWSPEDDENIKIDERVYFTETNGKRIDKYRHLLNQLPPSLQPLAPLLIKCSMHNNTNGQFSAFYKMKIK